MKNDRLKQRWLCEQNKTLPAEYELLKRAAERLVKNIASVEDLPWEPYQCITPGELPAFEGIWNWDTAFHAMAVSRWDTDRRKYRGQTFKTAGYAVGGGNCVQEMQ